MTKEQADEMLAILRDIRAQVARTANAVAKDNRFVFFPEQADLVVGPSGAHTIDRL